MAGTAIVGYLKAVFQLDTKEAEVAAGKIEGLFGKKISSSLEGMAGKAGILGQALGALGPAGLAAGAAIGAVSAFTIDATKQFIEQSDRLDDLANRYGLSRTALDAWGEAAKESGITSEQLGHAAQKLGQNVQLGSTAFERLGLSLKDLKGLSIDEQFVVVGKRILELSTEAEQNAAAMETMGKSGADALQALRGGMLEGLPASMAYAKGLEESRTKAAEMADKFTALGSSWERFKQSIAQNVGLPILDKIADFFLNLEGGGMLKPGGDGGLFLEGGAGGGGRKTGLEGVGVDRGSLTGKPDKFISEEEAKKIKKAWDDAFKTMEKSALEFAKAGEEGLLDIAAASDKGFDSMAKLVTEESKLTEEGRTLNLGMRSFNMLIGPATTGTANTKKEAIAWKAALQGIALLAGAIGGKFGEVLGVFQNIGTEVLQIKDNWGEMSKGEKIGAIGNVAGLLGGAVGGKAGGFLQGAGGGAAMGAGIGGLLGPAGVVPGAIIGGLAGGIMGLFGASKKKAEEAKRAAEEAKAAAESGVTAFNDMGKALQEKVLELTTKGVTGLDAMLTELGKNANANEADFERMGSYASALFGSLREQGLTTVQALEAMGPVLDKMAASGMAGGAVTELINIRNVQQANQELFAAAQGVADLITALLAGGSMSQEVFTSLQADVQRYNQELRDAGLTADQANAIQAESLFRLKKASEDYGLTLDANTQALIDEAEAHGLFEGLEDPMEVLVEIQKQMLVVLAELAKYYGVTLPDSIQKTIDKTKKIPPPPGVPGGGGETTTGDQGGGGGDSEPHFATGGVVTRPTRALIGERGPEVVAPVSAFFDHLAAKIVAGMGQQQVTILVDPTTGNARQLSTAEARRLQASLNVGQIRVPKSTVG